MMSSISFCTGLGPNRANGLLPPTRAENVFESSSTALTSASRVMANTPGCSSAAGADRRNSRNQAYGQRDSDAGLGSFIDFLAEAWTLSGAERLVSYLWAGLDSVMKRPAQRVIAVARGSLGHARGLRRHVESMKCPGIEVKLHGYPCSGQAPRVIQIFFEKQIEGADADEGARKTGE